MEDIKALDIMNYPGVALLGAVPFHESEEFQSMARTTFKTMFPSGKFPALSIPGFENLFQVSVSDPGINIFTARK